MTTLSGARSSMTSSIDSIVLVSSISAGLKTVVLVPALAVDRIGVRLGRGAGFYDRSVPLAAPGARLVAVVRDDELVEQLPAEPHDVRMTHALTPSGGLTALGGWE